MKIKYLYFLCLLILGIKVDLKAEQLKGKILFEKDTLDVKFSIELTKEKGLTTTERESIKNGLTYDYNGVDKFLNPTKAERIEIE